MTLIEMLVAMSIFTMGIAGFSFLFIRVWKTNSFTLEMGQASMAVSQGVGKMVNYVRGAKQADNGSYPIKSANSNDLVIYSDFDKDGVTERLHFYKNNLDVMMGVTDPTVTMPKTYPSGDQDVLTIASHIVNGNNEPIFYYFNKDYPGDAASNPLNTPATVSEVRLVKIHLKINVVPNRDPDNIEMESFAEMRNLNDYDRLK